MNGVDYPIISDEEMPLWENWIEKTTGIVLEGRKRVLEQGIYPRLIARGLSSLEQYRDMIDFSAEGRAEQLALIDQLTVKDSGFFRNAEAMQAVGAYLRRRSREVDIATHDFRIWSVGCALGQEAYSLGMVAAEQFAFTDVSWQVLGTDISPTAVIRAQGGHYSEKQVTGISKQRLGRFFSRVEDGWQVSDELRDKVRFGASNLKDVKTCPFKEQDVIFCQNVLIYFRTESVHRILDELVKRLRPDGLLVLGCGEAPNWTSARVSRWQPEILNAYRVREWM